MQIDEIRLKQIQSDIQHNSALKNNGIKLSQSGGINSGVLFDGVATDFGTKVRSAQNPNYNKNDLTDSLMNAVGNDDIHSENDVSLRNKWLFTAEKTSSDDVKNAFENGIDLKKKDEKEFTTVTDQIKEKFVKAGIDVSDMGGLSERKMEALSGGNAAELSSIKTAAAKASEINDVSLDDALYLVKNGQAPTIENVYRAEFSGSAQFEKINNVSDDGILSVSPVAPMQTERVSDINQQITDYQLSDDTKSVLDDIGSQLSDIFNEAGMKDDSLNRKLAGIFLENDIPVTAENLRAFSELSNGAFKDSPEKISKAIVDSINEGNAPEDAYVIDGLSNTEKAENAVKIINNVDSTIIENLVRAGKNLTVSNLALFENASEMTGTYGDIIHTDSDDVPSVEIRTEGNKVVKFELTTVSYQRTLSEAQLMMTSSATLSLYKMGIEVDTTDLSELVNTLKARENELYKILLGEDVSASDSSSLESLSKDEENNSGSYGSIITSEQYTFEEKIEIFESTNKSVSDFSDYPVSILGSKAFVSNGKNTSFSELHDLGEKTKAAYEKAGEEYETFGTEIRKDLGDSIKKAFRNVPDILKDLGLENTESNARAVRILGYNNTEITKENVLSIKNTDEKVRRTLANLKPGVVAEMVKNGDNPLDLSIDELYDKTEKIKASSDTDSAEENFGKFLWQAEKSGDISDEERQGFIGIARLCYQVEKTDGAVIGQLINEGRDITLRNMMSAVRTRRYEGKEYAVDDDFGGVNSVNNQNDITSQIDDSISSINASKNTEKNSGAQNDDENSLTQAEENSKAFDTERMRDASTLLTVPKMRAFGGEENYLKLSPDEFASSLEMMEKSKQFQGSAEYATNENAVLENFDIDTENSLETEYYSSIKQEISSATQAETQVYTALSAFDLPATVENLESMNVLMTQRNELYRSLFGNNHSRNVFTETTDGTDEKTISDVMNDLTNEFGEAVKTPESMAEAEEALYDLAEHALDDAIVDEKNGSVDVKAMRLKSNTMKFAMKLGNEQETFALPIKIADQNGNMVLKIVRGRREDRGAFELSLFSEALGNVNASFKYSDGSITGTVSSDKKATKDFFENNADSLSEKMSEISESAVSIRYTWDSSLDANSVFYDNSMNYDFEIMKTKDAKARSEIQTSKLYAMARAFIENLDE